MSGSNGRLRTCSSRVQKPANEDGLSTVRAFEKRIISRAPNSGRVRKAARVLTRAHGMGSRVYQLGTIVSR